MGNFANVQTPVGVLYADINTSSASSTLINSVAGKSIVVLSISLVCSNALNVTFQSATGPTSIGGPYYCAQNGGIVLPHNEGGWFQTGVGQALLLALSVGLAVGGSISYTLV